MTTASPDSMTGTRSDTPSAPASGPVSGPVSGTVSGTVSGPGVASADEPLLRVRDLTVSFLRGSRVMRAVDGVSFDVGRGETLGLVGESGSGKTTIGRALMRLMPKAHSGTTGSVRFGGEELSTLASGRMREVRRRLQMIFQDPLSSFNPRRKVWDIVGEGLDIQGVPTAEREARIEQALDDVGMSRAMVEGRRPHQFSGGQCQRIAIARALALGPDLVVCDEPVASLDVSVQAQVINLLQDIKREKQLALIFISHDLAVVRNVSDRVAVLYMGRLVEIGDADLIYGFPAHPYTRTLLEAVPIPDPAVRPRIGDEAVAAPSRLVPPSGCRFRTRCPRAGARCGDEDPALRPGPHGQLVACHHPHEDATPLPIG
jgi:peptide/nickel transport system ATP-binding protein